VLWSAQNSSRGYAVHRSAGDSAELGGLLELVSGLPPRAARARNGLGFQGWSTAVRPGSGDSWRLAGIFDRFVVDRGQWRAWLRGILVHNLVALVEKAGAGASGIGGGGLLEQSLRIWVCGNRPASSRPSARRSSQAQRQEATAVLAEQMARLPGPYREVLRPRHRGPALWRGRRRRTDACQSGAVAASP
jgi:hypothetical protein